jgi:glycolate oxidase iron-sulfur subunit
MKLTDYSEIISRCSQCSFCQEFCPSFQAMGTENFLAKHRMNLIREVMIDKTMPESDRFREILDKCLLCTNCTRNCFSLVPIDEIVIAARSEMFKNQKGLGALKSGFMASVLKEKGLRSIASIAGSLAGKVGIGKNIPQISTKPFDSIYKGTIKAEGEQRGRAVYYTGCGSNFLFPNVGASVVKVLAANGIEVVIPENITCCGLPLISEGDIEGAADMMRRNIEALSGVDAEAIVMDCTSCRMMFMKKALKMFGKDDPIQEKIINLLLKIKEPGAYMVEKGCTVKGKSAAKKVTMHIPCHSDRTAEKNLLAMLEFSSAQYVAMSNPENCCGAGGTFYMDNSEMSEKLRKIKVDDIKATGADVVVTECPMCRFYIQLGLPDKKVMHPFEFMAGDL